MIRFDIEITDRTQERVSTAVSRLQEAVVRKSWKLVLELEAYIKTKKLSGNPLHVRSGALRRSITSKVEVRDGVVEARVFSDGSVPYANILERGGRTSPHEIRPVKAQALRFMMQGKTVFARVVHHPGSKIPAFAYMRSALDEMAPTIQREMESILSEETL